MSDRLRAERRRAADRRYNQSERGKTRRWRYSHSDRGRATKRAANLKTNPRRLRYGHEGYCGLAETVDKARMINAYAARLMAEHYAKQWAERAQWAEAIDRASPDRLASFGTNDDLLASFNAFAIRAAAPMRTPK